MTPLPDKDALRRAIRAQRRNLAALHPDAAAQAAGRLPLKDLPPFTVAAGYHALGSELSPWPVLRKLAANGARIALPVALAPATPLIFREWREGEALEADAARIPSPTDAAAELIPDLVIAPLLAFDSEGYRLGQGGGYYDRTLAGLRQRGPVFVIGLAYAGQEVPDVPRDAFDQPLDAILTETGYHRVRTKDV